MYTDIARSVVKSSVLMKVVIPLYLGILGKSADYGARFYVTAALTSQDQHVSVQKLLMLAIRH